jgi:hypothetical protein
MNGFLGIDYVPGSIHALRAFKHAVHGSLGINYVSGSIYALHASNMPSRVLIVTFGSDLQAVTNHTQPVIKIA